MVYKACVLFCAARLSTISHMGAALLSLSSLSMMSPSLHHRVLPQHMHEMHGLRLHSPSPLDLSKNRFAVVSLVRVAHRLTNRRPQALHSVAVRSRWTASPTSTWRWTPRRGSRLRLFQPGPAPLMARRQLPEPSGAHTRRPELSIRALSELGHLAGSRRGGEEASTAALSSKTLPLTTLACSAGAPCVCAGIEPSAERRWALPATIAVERLERSEIGL